MGLTLQEGSEQALRCEPGSRSKGKRGLHLGVRGRAALRSTTPGHVGGRERVSHPQEGSERDRLNGSKVSMTV